MKKIISLLLGSIIALTLSISAAFSAANEVRVAFFLEWALPNQEDKVKKTFDDALGVPVKWTNFATGGEMTEAMFTYQACRHCSYIWNGRHYMCCS